MFNIKDLINLRKINETKKKLIKIPLKKNKITKMKKIVKRKNVNKFVKIVKKKKILKFKKKKITKIEILRKKHRQMVNKIAKKFVNYNANRDKILKKSLILNKNKIGNKSLPFNAKKPKKSKNDVTVLVIACEYHGTPFPLSGCYNDANKFVTWITSIYPKADVTYLTDNPAIHNYNPKAAEDAPDRYPSFESTTFPTHDIVYEAITKLIKSKSKLKLLYMSGHGATANDVPAPIESTLVDINTSGKILKTMYASSLVNPYQKASYYFCNDYGAMSTASPLNDYEMYTLMKMVTKKQKMYIFTDCCHSGTLFNLPYVNVAEFMFKYDAEGNVITETAYEKDTFGHNVYDANNNPIEKKVPVYSKVIDLSNNVAKLPITMEDYNTLIADANTSVSYYDNITKTTKEQKKINIVSAEYPSNKKLKGDIIHISGTRDGTFSYESVIYDASFNVVDKAGAFTWSMRLLWNLGLQNFNLRDTYTAVVGLINNPIQIPVCCTSKFDGLNNPKLLTDLGPNASSIPYSINGNYKMIYKNKLNKNRLIKNKLIKNKLIKKQKQKIVLKKKAIQVKHKETLNTLLLLKKNK
jgi:hypothetical protein